MNTHDTVWILLAMAGGLYGLTVLYLYLFQRRMVFMPSLLMTETPASRNMAYEDIWLKGTDGPLHAWWIPGRPGYPALLYCHGNGGNISRSLNPIQFFHQMGVSVLTFDYPGFGQSAGIPSEWGAYDAAQAALDYLTQKRHLPPERILYYGASLGGGVATWLASTRPPPAAIFLEGAFTSVPDLGAMRYPGIPVRWLIRYRFDNDARITHLQTPLWIFHSPEDEIVPIRHGQRLFQRAREPKQFVALRGSHNEAFMHTQDRIQQVLEPLVNQIAQTNV